MADGATTEAGRAFPGAEDLAEGTVTEAGAGKPSVGSDAVSEEAAAALVGPVGASEEAAGTSVEVAIASVEAVAASVGVDTGEAEAEVVMAVGADSVHDELETLAADGKCCRPQRFRAV